MSASDQVLAAEWVLGTLEGDDCREAARRLATDTAFAASVALWQARLDAIDDLPAMEPSGSLWRRIDEAVDTVVQAPGTRTLRIGEGPWETLADGLERRLLFVDRESGTKSYYLRLKAGVQLPKHLHRQTEQCVVLQGELRIGELVFRPGDFHVGLSGHSHETITAVTDALIFLHGGL